MTTVGIDEVGRGCWAGPLVAGAVVLREPIAGLKDSKKLSKLQRQNLTANIELQALAMGLGWVSVAEVDELGVTAATALAMRRALSQIQVPFDEIIIDGNINYFPDDKRTRAIIKADDIVPAVSAASIIAKVSRDNYMAGVAHKRYPAYGFNRHVGYGTALHRQMLELYGVSDMHRKSFQPIQMLMESPA